MTARCAGRTAGHHESLSLAGIQQQTGELGLNLERLRADMAAPEIAALIAQNIDGA